MFRGEPVALWELAIGYFYFLLTMVLGAFMSRFPSEGVEHAHYVLAFFGWIGLLILGAQLQFYRALTAIRKYTPEVLRHFFLFLSGIGVLFWSSGYFLENTVLILLGLSSYTLACVIQFYWLLQGRASKYFKFPLDYFFTAQFFLFAALIMFYVNFFSGREVFTFFGITHVLTLGWITLTLQGALIRVFPMFVGQAIDRKMKPYLKHHYYFSTLSSLLAVSGFVSDNLVLLAVGGSLWGVAWIWVLIILARSVLPSRRKLLHPLTLGFMVPGLFWFGVGSLFGLWMSHVESRGEMLVATHVHITLLAGLSLIMVGALHRIFAFQIFTILYTGRRNEVSENSLLRWDLIKYALPGFLIGPPVQAFGFWFENTLTLVIGASFTFISALYLGVVFSLNFSLYLKEKKNALPIHLKKGETD